MHHMLGGEKMHIENVLHKVKIETEMKLST